MPETESAPISPSTGDPIDDTLTLDEPALELARELSASTDPAPAEVPGFTIVRKLGEGGYGSVWLARERNTGKQVAIKFYSHRRGLDWSLLNREVEKLAVLYTARHVVGLIEVGWDADPPYYVMEYLENGSVAGLVEQGPLPAGEAVRIGKAVASALATAHGAGILHCDLKPANVLLDSDLEPRICDFGQSRLSDDQRPSLGTLFYMAPEQACQDAVPDARWDVYAIGALLYHMLVGHPPGRTPEAERRIRACTSLADRLEAYRSCLREDARPVEHRGLPGVDRRLADIVDRCLALDPRERFPNVRAVLDALRRRDRHRSRRPLLLLGILAPAALLAVMAPIVGDAMRNAVVTAEEHLTDRALESDALSATILSRSLERDLQDRMAELVRIAGDDDLRQAILAADTDDWGDRAIVRRWLDERRTRTDEERAKQGRNLDTSWFLTDRRGIQRWRAPYSEETDLHCYVWRDYFHGLGEQLPEDTDPGSVPPIDVPHLSRAFRSQATLRFMVAWSVPVTDDEGNVIAVLARTTHLDELLADYEFSGNSGHDDLGEGSSRNGTVDRVVALVDGRDGKFLNHEWMTTSDFRELSASARESLRLPERHVARLAPLVAGGPDVSPVIVIDDFEDRFAAHDHVKYGGTWLAACAPVGDTGWIAIIQERRRHALQPIEEMRADLVRYGLIAVAAAIGLLGTLWYFVGRALVDRA